MFPRFVKFKEGAKLTYDGLRQEPIKFDGLLAAPNSYFVATLTLYARLAKLIFRTAGRKGTGRGSGAWSRAQISFPFPFECLPRMLRYS